MKATTILITLLITILAGTPSGPNRSEAEEPGPAAVVTGDAAQIAAATDAINRFRNAGLRLPPLDITYHEHRTGCRGHQGVLRMVDGVGDIEICGTTRQLLLHEIAHAWEAASVSEETRDAVKAYWNVDNWNDHDQPPRDRGAEKVANAVVFALDNPPADPNPTLLESLCSYRLVTGLDLPSGLELDC